LSRDRFCVARPWRSHGLALWRGVRLDSHLAPPSAVCLDRAIVFFTGERPILRRTFPRVYLGGKMVPSLYNGSRNENPLQQKHTPTRPHGRMVRAVIPRPSPPCPFLEHWCRIIFIFPAPSPHHPPDGFRAMADPTNAASFGGRSAWTTRPGVDLSRLITASSRRTVNGVRAWRAMGPLIFPPPPPPPTPSSSSARAQVSVRRLPTIRTSNFGRPMAFNVPLDHFPSPGLWLVTTALSSIRALDCTASLSPDGGGNLSGLNAA